MTRDPRDSFDRVMEGLGDAVTHSRGEPVPGLREAPASGNPFADMTLAQARESEIWACVDVAVVTTPKGNRVTVSLDFEGDVDLETDPADPNFAEDVHTAITLDFQELAAVIRHKVALTAALPLA